MPRKVAPRIGSPHVPSFAPARGGHRARRLLSSSAPPPCRHDAARARSPPPAAPATRPLTTAGGEKYVVRRGAGARRGPHAPVTAGRCCCSRSSPIRRSPTRCPRRAWTSPTRPAARSSPPGARRRPWACRCSTRWCAASTPTGAARSSRATASAARPGFAITTGDLADNQQLNETTGSAPCSTAARSTRSRASRSARATRAPEPTPAQIDAINADVAARHYTGVQDYDDYATAPDDRKAGFWDPDVAAPVAGPYAAFPRYPGLMERAQAPFTAAGLDVPWYISRGNHDGLIQGNAPASTDLFRAIADRLPEGLPERGVRPRPCTRATPRTSCSPPSATPPSSPSCSPAAAPSRPTPTAGSSPRPSTAS